MSRHCFDGLRSRRHLVNFANHGRDHETGRRSCADLDEGPAYVQTTDTDQIEQCEVTPARVPQRRAGTDIKPANQHAQQDKAHNDSPCSEITVEFEDWSDTDAGTFRELLPGESRGEVCTVYGVRFSALAP